MKTTIHADRLAALRAEMKSRGVDGFIVPRADERQGEYVPACADRLKWLTGFSGSAGFAAVLMDKGVVMSDGRYTLQLAGQVDPTLYETANSTKTTEGEWLAANAGAGAVIGYDPKLHTPSQLEKIQEKLKPAGIAMKALESNPLDAVWADRPAPPMEAVRLFPEKVAGRTTAEKRALVANILKEKGACAAILTMSDSIAWQLNIRGNDVPCVPVPLSYAIVRDDGRVKWLIEPEKVPPEVHAHLGPEVGIIGPHALAHEIDALAAEAKASGKPVLVDETRSSAWFHDRLKQGGAQILEDGEDPCILPRACKTEAELQSIENVHVRDGLALSRFLAWLDREGSKGGYTEVSLAEKLEAFRAQDQAFRGPSFDTICGYKGNGAIVHYRASPESCKTVGPEGMLLLDSGGQYLDADSAGTTDVTRTMALGTPTPDMKKHFTLVVKGHIALATARFEEGTVGKTLDALARQFLVQAGLDYAHGTGHGVGCYLSVHEEAAPIAKEGRGEKSLRAGMVLSNEPGFYKEGEYGIRVENLVRVLDTGEKSADGKAMLAFKTLTLAPIDLRLVEADMLAPAEKDWLNDYHRAVWNAHQAKMSADDRAWLKNATRPV